MYKQTPDAMKKLLLVAFVISLAATSVTAQEKTTPRTEYTVSLSENVVKLAPGETKQVTVSILKSRLYAKSKAMLGLSSTLPDGITVAFEPAEGMFESSIASITAASTVPVGEYQFILKTTVNHKIKGSIVKLIVGSGGVKEAVTVN